ncbi:MAG TPA: single-stranded-DNA-specific exonuclease RecJ [Bryobacteraceae bacterium]|nr:single-stranded-DNA-specific exonuclease RecJ [Bryobacteraceae bacterium]
MTAPEQVKLRPAKWLLGSCEAQAVQKLAAELSLGLPVARVLYARGYRDPARALAFLEPRIEDLHDPSLMQDMGPAVHRVMNAVATQQRILLYGDYDVDGTTSIVILKKALDLLGASAEYFVPNRLKDGYGMRPEVIDRAAREGVALVISVDTGIRASAVVEHARTLGIDVIVTDHHLPEADLPRAVAVLNPNRPDCRYPEKNLCGAGVTFKLVQALLAAAGLPNDRVGRLLDSFLKLVAVATVADVVPLVGENRVIVKRGLEGFHTVRNAGLRALLNVAGFKDGDCPTAGQVAFRVAPRINAAGRMASASDVIEMFLTGDPARALTLATQLHDLNKERQDTEAEIIRIIHEICLEKPVNDGDSVLVFSGEGWHKGVVGIVASRMVDRYFRPVFVLSEDAATGLAAGSGRSVSGFHLLEALESMGPLFHKYGGHRQAAGVTLSCKDVEEFRSRLNSWAAVRLCPDDFCPKIEIDATLELKELTEETVSQVLGLAPFGFGNPTPVVAVLNAEIAGPPNVGDKITRIPIRQGDRTVWVKSWNNQRRWEDFAQGTRVDVAICLEEDAYSAARGYPGWCASVKDMRPAGAGPTQLRVG